MLVWKAKGIARNLVPAVAVVLLVLGASVVTALEGEPASKGLFAASGVRGSIDRAGEPTTIRTRYVDPKLELLFDEGGTPREVGAGSTLTLNLFDDTVLVAVLDRVDPNYGDGYTWVGQVQDEPLSLVILVVNDGVMAGTVSWPGGLYEVGYAGYGVHAVREVDPSAFPPEAGPIPVDIPADELADAVPAAVADDGSVIDVMVVYTPAARGAVGGTTAMVNMINLAVAETNQSYSNSGIVQRLNLVHRAEVSYTETSFDAALDHLQDPNDGKMDNVHTLRDTYFADEVVLIIDDPQYCGLAYLMQNVSTAFEAYAFAVVDWSCATGYYSFGHELGHNMGAQHDHYAVTKWKQAAGAYWYSYGYVNTARRWRTVMAYNDACADLGFNCTRIPHWSNPQVTYGGVPTGASDADNHLTLYNTAWTVANFRPVPPPPNAPTGLVATIVSPWRIDLSWTDTSSDETGFRIERRIGAGSWSTLASVGANTTSYPDTSVVPETTYSYRVVAYNAYGDSDPSNTASATTPPSAPIGLTATAVPPWRIDLSWTDTSGAESGFRIERRIGAGSWSTLGSVGANKTSYADTSALPETTYSYRVFAYNANGDSDPSNTASATLPEIIGPLVYDGPIIDDDGTEGTSGNDNGLLECGETVGLTVMLFNEGNTAVEVISTTLSFVGGTGLGDVDTIGNTTSSYPNIAGGTSEGNLDAFEFSVVELAEHGHWIDFELAITANNWSGGPIEFSLPILCSATADYRFYLPLIFK